MLRHTGLTISDLDRSLRFWRDAMGMRVLFEQEKAGGLFPYLAPSGGGDTQRPADVGFSDACITCDDREDRLDRLVAAGGVPFSGPVTIDTGANRGGRGLCLRDPDGHFVELFERRRRESI
jgi:catechol 2,3-dioxygenase-like lactoylglutathione lyase family enzyme